jgi:hypothetical protein
MSTGIVPEAIQVGISIPMNIRIIMGIVAILQPWMTPSSICFHFMPFSINTSVAKVIEKTNVKWMSGLPA